MQLQRTASEDLDGTVDAANKLDQTETKIYEVNEKSKINELADIDDDQIAEEDPDNETITMINERLRQRDKETDRTIDKETKRQRDR